MNSNPITMPLQPHSPKSLRLSNTKMLLTFHDAKAGNDEHVELA
jgi:hypothetical protein